jgi:hypothetical protein
MEAINVKTRPQAGMAEVQPDGSFQSITTRAYGDGAIRGRHKVTVVALDNDQVPTKLVPEKYATVETTPLEFDTANQPWKIVVERK